MEFAEIIRATGAAIVGIGLVMVFVTHLTFRPANRTNAAWWLIMTVGSWIMAAVASSSVACAGLIMAGICSLIMGWIVYRLDSESKLRERRVLAS